MCSVLLSVCTHAGSRNPRRAVCRNFKELLYELGWNEHARKHPARENSREEAEPVGSLGRHAGLFMPDLSIPRVFQQLLCPGGLWAISGWSWLKTFWAGKCVMETPSLTVELSVVGSWSLHRGFITPSDRLLLAGPPELFESSSVLNAVPSEFWTKGVKDGRRVLMQIKVLSGNYLLIAIINSVESLSILMPSEIFIIVTFLHFKYGVSHIPIETLNFTGN